MMKIFLSLVCIAFLFDATKAKSQSCNYKGSNFEWICTCYQNENLNTFLLHITKTIYIRNCDSVNVSMIFVPKPGYMVTKIKIEHVKNTLNLDQIHYEKHLEELEFLNIGKIESIGNNLFYQTDRINNFRIENTSIGLMSQSFGYIKIINFTMKNVIIENLNMFEFFNKENSHNFVIINCRIKVTENSITVHDFENIKITGTIFEFIKHGNISFNGKHVQLFNNIFINATVNVVGKHKIVMNNTCADGMSSVRLHSEKITSTKNYLPTEIIYKPERPELHTQNTVCKGGICWCLRNQTNTIPEKDDSPNYAITIHQEIRRMNFYLYLIIISFILITKI